MLTVAAVLGLAACGGSGGSADRGPTGGAVTGVVVQVAAASVTALASLDVRDATGRVWRFEADGFVGMTPSHLREHQALGEPVRVTYREDNGRLLIESVTDA